MMGSVKITSYGFVFFAYFIHYLTHFELFSRHAVHYILDYITTVVNSVTECWRVQIIFFSSKNVEIFVANNN